MLANILRFTGAIFSWGPNAQETWNLLECALASGQQHFSISELYRADIYTLRTSTR